MQRAFEIYPYCAMALNYLANHFFFTGQHFLVEQLTETALAVTNHGPTKAHSYYNLARSYHSKVGNNTLFLNTILMRCAKFLLAKKRWKEGEIRLFCLFKWIFVSFLYSTTLIHHVLWQVTHFDYQKYLSLFPCLSFFPHFPFVTHTSEVNSFV